MSMSKKIAAWAGASSRLTGVRAAVSLFVWTSRRVF